MHVTSRDACENHASLVLPAEGSPISGITAGQLNRDTWSVLDRLGTLGPHGRDRRPTPEGIAFARTALRTWP